MKRLAIVLPAVVSALLWTTSPSLAWNGNRGGSHSGFRGHHDGFRHRHHHGFGGARVFIGPGIFFGAPAFYPYPYSYYPYPYYQYPVDSAPPAVVESPPVYTQPPAQQYWYYCSNPPGYYPYVTQCPGGWLQVVPSPGPAAPGQGQGY
jgi:hypothetical protein